jgi:hypothetical protein
MQQNLTRNQIQDILNKAPKDMPTEVVLKGLVDRGFKLEGYNDTPKSVKQFTGSEDAPFQLNEEDSGIMATGKTIGNLPSSTFRLGKNIFDVVTSPVETVKSLATLAQGAGAKVGEIALENTDIGQTILEKANQTRIEKGLQPLTKNAEGKFEVDKTPELQAFDQVGKFFSDRYGSLAKFKETAVEDPAGVLSDIAALFSGAGVGLKGAGFVGAANKASEISRAVEPLSAISKTVKSIKNFPGAETATKVIADVSPTSYKVQQGQVVKALELTPGDLSNINKKTGNDVTKYIIENDLIKNSPEEIVQALNDKRKLTMGEVRGEIEKVKDLYSPENIPDLNKGLNVILKGVEDVPGLDATVKEIKDLIGKKEFNLSDVQKAKELIDENSNIYSKIGDVKSSSQAKGLDNIRDSLKTFIENEVELKTGGKVSIKNLNNDVQTTYAIEDAINNRAMKGMSRQHISAFDLLVGLGGSAFDPFLGVGLVIGKKVLESPSMRLSIAKALTKFSPEKIEKLTKDIKAKSISPESELILKEIGVNIKRYLPAIESGGAVLNNQAVVDEVGQE